MNPQLSRLRRKRIVSFSFLAVLSAFSIVVFGNVCYSQNPKLSLADILVGLRSKKVTIEERNKLLTAAVKTRGVTFAVTDEITKELEVTGADNFLIQAIKEKSAAVKPAVIPAEPAKIAAADPEYVNFQKQGDGFLVKGDYDLAIANYSKAIELSPKTAALYLSRGMAYYSKDSYDSAIADFTRGLELNPKETIAYYNRGDSFEKTGNPQKAVADYQKVLDLAPGNERAKTSLQRVKAEIEKAEQAKLEKARLEQAALQQPKVEIPAPQQSKTKVIKAEKESNQTALTPRVQNQNAFAEPPKEKSEAKKKVESEEKPESSAALTDVGQLTSERAVNMTQPIYPAEARKYRVGGQVRVQVEMDEKGKVVSAKTVSGATLLRIAAEKAALGSSFKPEILNGTPVKSTGFIVYNFKLD